MALSPEQVLLLGAGHRMARAVNSAAELDLADALLDGPRDVGELAESLGCDRRGLRLLLRALVSEGVFEQVDASDTFALNDGARILLSASQGGMREIIVGWGGHPAVYRGLERLADGVRTGRPAFEIVHGRGFFEWLDAHEEELRLYQAAVGGEDPAEHVPMLEVLDLSSASVIADVGGGGGGLLRAAVDKWPHLNGLLIELPAVAARTEERLATAGYADRIRCIAADCRDNVPAGADVYVMTTVLRYFDDDLAVRVLGHIRDALRSARAPRRVVLNEMPLDEGPAQAPAAMKSLVEYALSGGQDRTRAELEGLLTSAGFADVTHRPWTPPYVVTEAVLR